MAKIKGSGGLIRKRNIAILNIDSILNNFFLGRVKCQSARFVELFKKKLKTGFKTGIPVLEFLITKKF
jgi:hypothetical protein